MPDNPSTDSANESPYPDAEDWQNAFEVYAGHPNLAFSLALLLMAVQSHLQGERRNTLEARETLDLAVDTLYEHTDFRRVSHELFRAAVEGRISTEQEELLRELGVTI